MNLHETSPTRLGAPLPGSHISLLPNAATNPKITVPLRSHVVFPGEGVCTEWGDVRIEALLTSEQTNGQIGLMLNDVPEGAGPPLHVHEREDETFVILEGRFEFQIRDERLELGRGDAVFAPRGVPHTSRALEGGGRLCISFSPGGFEEYFPACAPLFGLGMPDMKELARVSQGFGLTFLDAYDPHLEAKMSPSLEPRVVRSGEGTRMGPPGEKGRRAFSPLETGGVLVGELEAEPGCGPPPHFHTSEDELFFVTEGRFEFWTGEARFEAGPGTLVYGPRDLPHTWRAIGDVPGKLWAWVLPGAGFEAFFNAYGVMLHSAAPDQHALARLASDYGIVILGPPSSVWS